MLISLLRTYMKLRLVASGPGRLPRGLVLALAAQDTEQVVFQVLPDNGYQEYINEPAGVTSGSDVKCTPLMA